MHHKPCQGRMSKALLHEGHGSPAIFIVDASGAPVRLLCIRLNIKWVCKRERVFSAGSRTRQEGWSRTG